MNLEKETSVSYMCMRLIYIIGKRDIWLSTFIFFYVKSILATFKKELILQMNFTLADEIMKWIAYLSI